MSYSCLTTLPEKMFIFKLTFVGAAVLDCDNRVIHLVTLTFLYPQLRVSC